MKVTRHEYLATPCWRCAGSGMGYSEDALCPACRGKGDTPVMTQVEWDEEREVWIDGDGNTYTEAELTEAIMEWPEGDG